jgi:hypothetical protein
LIGESEKFGIKEDIRAVLYYDHYAYVVISEKTDPLFIIDLVDPIKLKIMSEVQVPGFSTQLKLLSPTVLAGLGFNAASDILSEFSWFGGIKFSLFNIENKTQPFEVSSHVWGERGSFSEATSEPKAFYVADNGSRVIFPAVILKYDESQMPIEQWSYATQLEFAGAIVLKTGSDQLQELGRLTHSDWRESSCGSGSEGFMILWGGANVSRDIQRVFEYEGDYISFSRFGVRLYDSNSLMAKKELMFENNKSQCQRIDYLDSFKDD